MINNRGSALIIVLIIMSFVMVFATSTVSVTHSEEITSKSSNDSNTAFYIAEAGVERAINILNNEDDLQAYIDSSLSGLNSDAANDFVKSRIVGAISSYLSSRFPSSLPDSSNPKNTIKFKYQHYVTGSSGNETTNGLDTQKFSTLHNSPSYYKLTVVPAASPSPNYDGNLFTENISITSTGYYSKASRTITAVYRVEYTKNSTAVTSTPTAPTPDVNLEKFFSSSLSLVSPSQNGVFQFHQGCEIEGDTLIYNVVPDGGNKKKTVSIQGNLSYNNPTQPSNMTATSYTKISTSYTIPSIDFNKVPANSGNIVYISKNKPSNYLNTSEVSDPNKVYVILSSGSLTIDKKMQFKGVIYCQGKVILSGNGQGLELWGSIIAGGLEGKNHITIHKLNDSSTMTIIKTSIYNNIHPATPSGPTPLSFKNFKFNSVSWTE